MTTNTCMTLTEALKAHSRTTHDAVDTLVMSKQPFANRENYAKFLQAQYAFHHAVHPIYQLTTLGDHINGLDKLSRLAQIQADMAGLGVIPYDDTPAPPPYTDNEAVGWLYCVEGSNVGAAVLYKEAGKIALSDNFGAAHLAAHPDGRMSHWRSVKKQIDTLPLNDDGRQAAMKGADDAFAYYKLLIRTVYG